MKEFFFLIGSFCIFWFHMFRLIAFCHNIVDKCDVEISITLVEQSITCLSRVAGLLMNMSHENG